jgi:ankyrin repeat protein
MRNLREHFMKRLYAAIIVLGLAASLQVKTSQNADHNYIRQVISQSNPNVMINGTPLLIYVTMQLVRLDKAHAAEWHNLLTTLLNRKVNVDVLDTKEYTALMYAAYYGHCPAAALLLNHGAQAMFYNKNGESALTVAYEGQKYASSETQKKQYAQLIALLTNSTNRRARS